MKIFIALLAGVLLGAAAAAAVLYLNPLSQPPMARGEDADGALTLRYRFPAGSTIALTHDGSLQLPYQPHDIPPLWEETLSGVVLNVLVLEDENGMPQALASRVSVPSPDTDLLLRGVIVADHWLVTAPGRGSMFVEAHNNVWSVLKDTLPVAYLNREWRGPTSYSVTAGPAAGGTAAIVGATGAWSKVRGAAREAYDIEQYSASGGLEAMEGELVLEFSASEGAALPESAALEPVQP